MMTIIVRSSTDQAQQRNTGRQIQNIGAKKQAFFKFGQQKQNKTNIEPVLQAVSEFINECNESVIIDSPLKLDRAFLMENSQVDIENDNETVKINKKGKSKAQQRQNPTRNDVCDMQCNLI